MHRDLGFRKYGLELCTYQKENICYRRISHDDQTLHKHTQYPPKIASYFSVETSYFRNSTFLVTSNHQHYTNMNRIIALIFAYKQLTKKIWVYHKTYMVRSTTTYIVASSTDLKATYTKAITAYVLHRAPSKPLAMAPMQFNGRRVLR